MAKGLQSDDESELNNLSSWCWNLKSVSVRSESVNHMMPQDKAQTQQTPNGKDFGSLIKILSFNVLAEAYLTPRSHPCLPLPYASVAFDRNKRRPLLMKTLQRLGDSYDIMCLQEVDLYEEMVEALPEFDSCHSKIEGRTDRCVIFWRKSSYKLVEHQIVEFDELANIGQGSNHKQIIERLEDGCIEQPENSSGEDEVKVRPTQSGSSVALSGMLSSFVRRNTACIAILEQIDTEQKFATASAHLYWNPGYEYVKLVQAKYLVEKLHQIALEHSPTQSGIDRIPVLLCGDFNSTPGSAVHQFLSEGIYDARTVAPWSAHNICNSRDCMVDRDYINNSRASGYTSSNAERNAVISENQDLRKRIIELSRRGENLKEETDVYAVHYMLDYTLNRFTRWLRILGLDAALETEQEEKIRTRRGAISEM